MEASAAAGQAAPAADAQQQQQQGEQTPEQQQAAQAQQLDPALLESIGTIPQQLEAMRQWMEDSALQQQQPFEDRGPDGADTQPPDLSFVDPQSPNYDPQQAATQLLGILEAQNKDALQQAIAPLQQQLSDVQAAREADALASEFPDLQKPEVADAVFKATADWVQAAGLPPEAAGNMQVVRAVYMMGRAAELHNEEQAGEGDQSAASLEGAGGASPGGTGGALTAESILGAPRRSPLPFS